MIVGTEWLVEAYGCDQEKLRDEGLLREVFRRLIDDLGLKALEHVWHKFPGEGGVTGMVALTESHLACHTYPEHGIATFNLYCCRSRPEWDWESNLNEILGARKVAVTKLERGADKPHTSGQFSQTTDGQGQAAAQRKPADPEAPESQISDLKFQSAGGER